PAGAEQFVGAVIAAFRRLDGLNAIAILDVHTGQLVAVKSGSPLVVGGGDGGNLLASDYAALLEHTRRVTFVDDRRAVLITREGIRLFDVDTGRELCPEITEVRCEAAAADLSGYPDFMTKEIHEQPAVLRRSRARHGGPARRLAALLRQARRGLAVGWRSAGHGGRAAP